MIVGIGEHGGSSSTSNDARCTTLDNVVRHIEPVVAEACEEFDFFLSQTPSRVPGNLRMFLPRDTMSDREFLLWDWIGVV